MELITSKMLDVCSGIGRLMLENGAETYRVEDTVYRVAVNYGMQSLSVFSFPAALIITVQDQTGREYTRLHRVTELKSNLGIVSEANTLSRRIAAQELSPHEAMIEIDKLERKEPAYTPFQEILVAGLICAFFTIIFLGNFQDFIAAGILGAVGYAIYLFSLKVINIRFFSELVASFSIAWLAILLLE